MTRIRNHRFLDRTGEISRNNLGTEMVIIEYLTSKNIVVRFEDKNKYTTNASYDNFKRGKIKNPYDLSLYGIGFIGVGRFKVWDTNRIGTEYSRWKGLLQRCYDKKYQKNHPAYKGCIVDPEWHNFQNFAEWYNDNLYVVNNDKIEIDKDILIKRNKIYGPETCILVPKKINLLFAKRHTMRGKTPIGVIYCDDRGKYKSTCHDINGKTKNLGYFSDPKSAFLAYKNFKEETIKYFAENNRNIIPFKLYNAMIKYQVEEND